MNTHTNKSLMSCWVNAVVMMAAYNTEIFALKKQIWVQSVRVTAEWSITVFFFTLDATKKKRSILQKIILHTFKILVYS